MAIIQERTEQTPLSAKKPLISAATYDWFFLLPAVWFLTGAYLDAWAHNHLPLDNFFTPWHAVLYSGFLAVALGLVSVILINRSRGAGWYEAIPLGYELSVFGMFGFIVGAVGDLLWHTLFGIELNIDGVMSPTHLVLMLFGGLFLAGPLRSLYRRADNTGRWQPFLLFLAVAVFFTYFTLDSQVFNVLVSLAPLNTPSFNIDGQALAVTSMVVQTVIFTGIMLYTIRRWRLFPGFFTLLWPMIAIPLSYMQDDHIIILIAAIAGLIIDGAYLWLRPSMERVFQLRIFAAIAPAALYLVYFLVLQIAFGIVWTIHLSAGSVFVTGATGWLLTYIMIPGRGPQEQAS